jgi:MFS family permease
LEVLAHSAARRIGVGLTIVIAAVLSDVPMLLLPIVTNAVGNSWLLLLCAFFVQGVGITGCNVHVTSMRQALIPDALRGCANASYRLLVSGMLPIGALLSGFLGTWIGLRWILLIAALGLLSTWLWIIFSPIPHLREPLERPAEAQIKEIMDELQKHQ